ncbi:EamA family transporter [Salinigranum sp. GCM10025319]|uniref:EamA family transporter n=1 Tax=Salinigranum sp. GCM10025319 TaxID=3252687 RepID=UPI0036211662
MTVQFNYVLWALVACISYSFVPPLVRVATREIPSDVAALMSNVVLVAVIFALVVHSGVNVTQYVRSASAVYLLAAGLFLGVGIVAYYRALELGPVTHVVPIFAMFIVGGSVLGVAFLGEDLSVRNVMGIVFGLVAIYLITS